MTTRSITFAFIASAMVLFTSCKKDPKPTPPEQSADVIIVNKGVALGGVGTISIYNPITNEVEQNIFQKANSYNTRAVAQSVLVDGDITFLVISGEGVVYIVNTQDFKVIAKVTGLGTPRYVTKAGENKYYISDWSIRGVHIFNLKARKVVGQIVTGSGPENMLIYKDRLFVVNSGGVVDGQLFVDSTVTVIQTETDTIMDTLFVGQNPNSLQLDKNNKLWVLSPGITKVPVSSSTFGDFRTINPDSLEIIDTIVFADNLLKPRYLKIDKEGEYLYFLSDQGAANIHKHSVEDTVLTKLPYIMGNFNCLEYDEVEE
ncbi:MAG: YncE family protein, partial [Owenweeksia sp.]